MRAVTEILGAEAPATVPLSGARLRVLVAEPDAVRRRLICSLLRSEMIVVVEPPSRVQMLDAIKEAAPDILVGDARSLSPPSQSARGREVPSATIVTAYDPADLAITSGS